MKNLLDKAAIIKLKQEGLSNRGVARTLGIDKKTVNKYWNEYKENIQKLNETTNIVEISEIFVLQTIVLRNFKNLKRDDIYLIIS